MQNSGKHSEKVCILDSTNSVGGHVGTWIHKVDGHATRTKVYKKVVSHFEAEETLETFDGYAADYVDCPNKHLRRTFEHPDVRERGCTRIEESHYGCLALSSQKREELVAGELRDVQVEEARAAEKGLFVVQPQAKHWQNFAKHLDCWYPEVRRLTECYEQIKCMIYCLLTLDYTRVLSSRVPV